LQLIVDCPALSNAYVDREMWEKIVLNLLSNAFKFTFKGEISVSLRQTGETMELAVRDTGTGIPAAELPHVFERFHRVRDARGRSLEGSGIGLALVQELVKLHGGTVRVDSQVDRGSTFTVTIPLGTAHLPVDRIETARPLTSIALRADVYVEEALRWLPEIENADLKMRPEAHLPGTAEMTAPALHPVSQQLRPRILLADDNSDMREYVGRLLSGQYQVEAATDGQQALRAARAHPPDLVLSDVMMPRLDGFGLLKALRADERLKTVPVILLSARAGEEASVEGIESGADDYLIKPFSARELLARVDGHLKMARLRTEAEKALRGSEERFRLLVDNVQEYALIQTDHQGKLTSWNPGAQRLFGYSPAEILGQPFSHLLTVEDQQAGVLDQELASAVSGIGTREERWLVRKDGSQFWAQSISEPVHDEAARLRGVVKVIRDETERKRSEERRLLLMAELNHRVQNTLATVQSMASQTLRGSTDPVQFVEKFRARLQALSRAHNLLTRSNWQSADVIDLMHEQLMMDGDIDRVNVRGATALLTPQPAVALSLVLHELGTNARKYGALAAPAGRLNIDWRIDNSQRMLLIEWAERGGPPVAEPKKRGFGTSLIEKSLRGIGGSAELQFNPGGLHCAIKVPLFSANGNVPREAR
jgi:PAS domain S-box-containing protein